LFHYCPAFSGRLEDEENTDVGKRWPNSGKSGLPNWNRKSRNKKEPPPEAAPVAVPSVEVTPPAHHHYGAGVMRWYVRFVLEAATSLRAASRVLEVLQGWLPGADWGWLMDHTIQMGQVKCLLIVAVRLSAWETEGRGPLEHQDLTVLALEPRCGDGPEKGDGGLPGTAS
jgi:hypothetical protein